MGEEELRLYIGEVEPQAHVRAAAERNPRIFVPPAHRLGREAHRSEPLGLGPIFGHHIRVGGIDPDVGAGGYQITDELEITERPARERGERRDQTQPLPDTHCASVVYAAAVELIALPPRAAHTAN